MLDTYVAVEPQSENHRTYCDTIMLRPVEVNFLYASYNAKGVFGNISREEGHELLRQD